jgi:CubicO group peptidase (beta-lactamase class C family)
MPVLVFLLFLQPVSAQYNWKELDENLQIRQKMLGTDAVVMIWKNDSLIYKREAGNFKLGTVAPIASCSKWLTAALVMQFVDEGKISLDDYVVKYIPEFEKYFKNYITIRQCLSHMTGIEDEGGLKKLFKRRKFDNLEQEVNGFAANNIRDNPGKDFWYGNIGLNIAGRVLEVVSKRKFDQLIRAKLLYPLGMRKTTFTDLTGGAVNPSGGAKSTAEDYMKFLVMLLNKGKYNGVQILSEASVNEMMKIQTKPEKIKYAPITAEGFNYASGSWVLEEKGGKATALACPGLFGTWPMIDYCRGYAYLFFVKDFLGEEKATAQMGFKNMIDHQIATNCK